MTPVSPTWWKWPAVLFLGIILAGVFVWRGEKYNQVAIGENQEAAESSHPVPPPKSTQPPATQSETKTPEKLSEDSRKKPQNDMEEKFNERTALMQRLQKETARELLSRLETLWNARATGSLGSEEEALTKIALTQALHSSETNANAAVYQELAGLLRNDALPLSAKMEIASMLGSVQTPQSVQILLVEYQQATDASLRESLGNAIARTGDNLWAQRVREDLSPPLEGAWLLAKGDPNFAQAIANGLAKVGTAAGVQLLVNEVLRSSQTVEGLSDLNDAQGQAAYLALEKVRNTNAVIVLAAGLLDGNSSEVQRYISGMALAAMGKVEATQVLLRWAATASDQEAVWAELWFGKLRDTASFNLVAAALSQTNSINFTSAAIKNAVVLGQGNRER